MRRGFGIGVMILVILAGVAIGVGAYNAGLEEGIARGLTDAGEGSQVVRVVGDGFRGGFPLGLIFFPLFLFAIFGLFRGAFWRGRWERPGPGHGHGPWENEAKDWHRRQHEGSGMAPSEGGGSA